MESKYGVFQQDNDLKHTFKVEQNGLKARK